MSSLLLTSAAGAGPGHRGLAVRAGAGEGGADGGDLVAVQDQVPGLLPRQDVVNLEGVSVIIVMIIIIIIIVITATMQ